MTLQFEETEEAITLHGLGFIQVKLQGKQRLHVWHPDLPRRSCFEVSGIHNHRFSFVSRILVGTQINHDYKFTAVGSVDDNVHHMGPVTHIAFLHEGERTQYGNRPWVPELLMNVSKLRVLTMNPGEEYHVEAYRYHSTEPGGDGRVATIMTKEFEGTQGAHSLCEVGHDPDVDFDRKQWADDRLWAIVRNVLGQSPFVSQH